MILQTLVNDLMNNEEDAFTIIPPKNNNNYQNTLAKENQHLS